MYQTARTNQGGSIATFLIVGALLAAAVVAGVYFVRQRGEDTRGSQPVMEQPRENEKEQGGEDKPAPAPATPTPAPAPQPQPQPQSAPQTGTAPAPSPTAPTGQLPQTGPADTVAQLVTIGVMLAALGMYLRSYVHRFGSLLK